MSSYLAKKYSDLLSVEDVLALFRRLEETYGSISEAARICGIERKTVYLWRTNGYIRPQTKEKVVKALLEAEPEQTLSYMAKRSVNSAAEVLMTSLSSIYEKAIEQTDSNRFLELAEIFDRVKVENSGLITDKLQKEVSELVLQISSNAARKGINWLPKPFGVFRAEQLEIVVPMVTREILAKGPERAGSIAARLSLPEALVSGISEALTEIETRRLEYERIPQAQETFSTKPLGLQEDIMSASTMFAGFLPIIKRTTIREVQASAALQEQPPLNVYGSTLVQKAMAT